MARKTNDYNRPMTCPLRPAASRQFSKGIFSKTLLNNAAIR